jgi:hypothetical protein
MTTYCSTCPVTIDRKRRVNMDFLPDWYNHDMNLTYQALLGGLATIIAFFSYIPYFKDIFAGKTKPHVISWFIWGLLTGIGFLGQISDNAGAGAWVTGFTACICFGIFVAALRNGEKCITRTDWLCLVAAGISLSLWYFTKTPLLSLILITVVDALGFIPTFRKSYVKPFEETLSTYFLSGLKYIIALFALSNFSILTSLYPISLIIMNWLFIGVVVMRRRQLGIVISTK